MASITVTSAQPHERAEALSLLYSRHPRAEQVARVDDALQAARHREISLQGLLVARSEGRIAGVLLAVFPHQGAGTAFVWPPVFPQGVSNAEAVADALLQEVGRRIDDSGAALGQCLLEQAEQAQSGMLARNGFTHAAELVYLERPLDGPLPAAESN